MDQGILWWTSGSDDVADENLSLQTRAVRDVLNDKEHQLSNFPGPHQIPENVGEHEIPGSSVALRACRQQVDFKYC